MAKFSKAIAIQIECDATDRSTLMQCIGLKHEGHAWGKIAKQVGHSCDWVKIRLVPGFAEARMIQRRYHRNAEKDRRIMPPRSYRRTQAMVITSVIRDAERLMAQIPHDTRQLTGRICGDPLPGRSALDQLRMKQQTEAETKIINRLLEVPDEPTSRLEFETTAQRQSQAR